MQRRIGLVLPAAVSPIACGSAPGVTASRQRFSNRPSAQRVSLDHQLPGPRTFRGRPGRGGRFRRWLAEERPTGCCERQRFGTGDLELYIATERELEPVKPIIERAGV